MASLATAPRVAIAQIESDKTMIRTTVLSLAAVALLNGTQDPAAKAATEPRPLVLKSATLPGSGLEVLRGTLEVYEDREAREGRVIALKVVVLPATSPEPKPDPIFFLAGGPGQAASGLARRLHSSWMRRDRDIVLVDQRGTGESNPLSCNLAGSADEVAGYLEPIFQEELFRDCLEQLEQRADLTLYSTPIAMDDLDEVRAALGYETINLIGGSYGTRAALVYMRRHPERVRAAILKGVAPIAFRNPLYHAREAQKALERTFDACERSPACRAAFPSLREEFEAVLARLEEEPVELAGRSAASGTPVAMRLDREAFAEALRVMMYSTSSARRVPLAIHRAFGGEYMPFAQLGVQTNRALRDQLAFGMLLCVTCAEDVARIDPDEVERETAGTFLGPGRVRRQMRICGFWPKGRIPDDYGEPVSCDAPTLIFSGTLDPVTSSDFGAEAARHLPNSLHLVVPSSHNIHTAQNTACLDAIIREFLERGTTEGLDTSCVDELELPPFELPG